jgi:8-amino-7-oxononanoate synthase
MSLDDDVRAELRELEAAHLIRGPRVVAGAQGVRLTLDGRHVLSFASNDYLGLAGDRRLAAAAAATLDTDGVGAGASRLIVGNHRQHVALEAELADWFRCEGVRLFNTGYAANVGVLTTLLREGDVVFSDALNHASIIDGCRLSRATIAIYPHLDLEALDRALATVTGGRRVVVSETLFSMDGDIADVLRLAELCRKHSAALILDEAHAIGVLGPEGRGVAAHCGVVPDVLVGTFGKALGTFGAFVASTRAIATLLWNRARPLVFSTGLPPSIAAATRTAVSIARGSEGEQRRRTLGTRGQQLRALVSGLAIGGDVRSPILPIQIGDEQRVLAIAAQLFDANLCVAAVRPPTVPLNTARLRVSLSAIHDSQDISKLGAALTQCVGKR